MKYIKLFEDINNDWYEEVDEDTFREVKDELEFTKKELELLSKLEDITITNLFRNKIITSYESYLEIGQKGFSIIKGSINGIGSSSWKEANKYYFNTIWKGEDGWFYVVKNPVIGIDDRHFFKCDQFDGC